MLVSPPVLAQSPLWAFSLQVYQVPDVARHLLSWQNTSGIWINDWLFAMWKAEQGSTVSHDFRQQIAEWQHWRDQVIVPWRRYRQSCKPGPAAVYAQAKSAELALEWCDQRYLYRHRTALSALAPATDNHQRLAISLQRLTDWSATASEAAADALLSAAG